MFPDDTVYFYAQTDDYAEFSNFAPYGMAMDGLWWPTVEHFFQAKNSTTQSIVTRSFARSDQKMQSPLG